MSSALARWSFAFACPALTLAAVRGLGAQASSADAAAQGVQVQSAPAPGRRIPQQKNALTGVIQGLLLDEDGRPLPGVAVKMVQGSASTGADATTEGDGIFRLLKLMPGLYDLVLTQANGGESFRRKDIQVNAGEVLSVEIQLAGFRGVKSGVPVLQSPMEIEGSSYHELTRRPDAEGAVVAPKDFSLPEEELVFQPMPDRWNIETPNYHRYPALEVPYVMGRWFDPFNRNRLKGDKPLFGKTFFSFTGDSITAFDGRRLPLASGQSTARADETSFFGRGGQVFTAQTVRMTFDLFHGDTTSFKPVDWRIRVTPALNLNYLATQENQVVSPNVRLGTARFDTHVSLQEAFGEVKLKDLGPNYDFVNVRIGIQQFVSDFRGFIFADEQPGVRIFGNLRSNRYQYNLAGFDFLEKNTNSGLNSFARRGRELAIANLFIQDFFARGYTAQFSYHFLRDDGRMHYDDNGFLVRPAPIGTFARHRIDTDYIGWTGDGHIGRTNITHAFYQALGTDTFNQIAARRTSINAQLGAVELSRDASYLRFRGSFLYASGDDRPLDGVARGFSSIVDAEAFAGGEFSFFNREGIRLTGTGVALTANDSFLPDLRSSKDEGQSNFVNPGIYLYNVGADAKVTPTLKVVTNINFLQFARTQSLVFLLQQQPIRRTIGTDGSIGAIWRPFLSDNIVLTGGAAGLLPARGLRDFYTSQTLFSLFGTIRFQF